MQIISFPSHYQLVYVNFDIFSFSLISYKIRMIFIQNKRIIYTQDWYFIPEKIQTGIIFDPSIRKLKIKKGNAKFRIEKKHDMYLLIPINGNAPN